MWITKKKLKKQISDLEEQLKQATLANEITNSCNKRLTEHIDKLTEEFPFELGTTVYTTELRNAKGRFTKKNFSFEHSSINEVVVDKKNYFKLVEKYNKDEVFLSRDTAECFLESMCD